MKSKKKKKKKKKRNSPSLPDKVSSSDFEMSLDSLKKSYESLGNLGSDKKKVYKSP